MFNLDMIARSDAIIRLDPRQGFDGVGEEGGDGFLACGGFNGRGWRMMALSYICVVRVYRIPYIPYHTEAPIRKEHQ
jgi:hypothetical protein